MSASTINRLQYIPSTSEDNEYTRLPLQLSSINHSTSKLRVSILASTIIIIPKSIKDNTIYKCVFTGLTRADWYSESANMDPKNPLYEIGVSKNTKCNLFLHQSYYIIWTNIPPDKWPHLGNNRTVIFYKFKSNVYTHLTFPKTVLGYKDDIILVQTRWDPSW
jgi:hypothetical protein